jgi:hypothetical protein
LIGIRLIKNNSLKFDLAENECFICSILYFSKIAKAINNAKINIEACLQIWLCGILANKRANGFSLRADIVVENPSCRGKRNFRFAANYLIFKPVCELAFVKKKTA